MQYSVRIAAAEDLQALTELYLAYGEDLKASGLHYEFNISNVPNVIASRIKSRMFMTGVAESAGKLVGFVFCSILRIAGEYLCEGSGVVGYLNDIYVTPVCRKQGVAEALAAYAENWLRENDVKAMELQVLSGNHGAQVFWNNHGVQPVGTFFYKKL